MFDTNAKHTFIKSQDWKENILLTWSEEQQHCFVFWNVPSINQLHLQVSKLFVQLKLLTRHQTLTKTADHLPYLAKFYVLTITGTHNVIIIQPPFRAILYECPVVSRRCCAIMAHYTAQVVGSCPILRANVNQLGNMHFRVVNCLVILMPAQKQKVRATSSL